MTYELALTYYVIAAVTAAFFLGVYLGSARREFKDWLWAICLGLFWPLSWAIFIFFAIFSKEDA